MKIPRIMITGASSNCGKTLVAAGLTRAFLERGLKPAPFTYGPDYIDPAWMAIAACKEYACNLDLYAFTKSQYLSTFTNESKDCDIAIVDGFKGMFDSHGDDLQFNSYNAAKALGTPCILVLDATGANSTIAAFAKGAIEIAQGVDIIGVVLNKVSNSRQADKLKKALEELAGMKVIGIIPKYKDLKLPNRDLQVTPKFLTDREEYVSNAAKLVGDNLDLDYIKQCAFNADELKTELNDIELKPKKVKIGYFFDQAFSFFYYENLKALENEGAELIPISPINDSDIDEIDGLYIGGGYPENYTKELAANTGLIENLKEYKAYGLPIYGECGGLIYLANKIQIDGVDYPMSGLLDLDIILEKKPQGLGYMKVRTIAANPFFINGTTLRGHEIHYSRVYSVSENLACTFSVEEGAKPISNEEGYVDCNVLGTYLHLNAFANPEWAKNFVKIAFEYKQIRS